MMMQRDTNNEELLQVICNIVEIKSMKAALKSSMQSGVAVGLAAIVGGLLLGSRGVALGGILGGLGRSYMTDGLFKPVSQIIMNETTEKQKEVLIKNILELFTVNGIMSLAILVGRLRAGDLTWVMDLVNVIIKTLENWNYEIEPNSGRIYTK